MLLPAGVMYSLILLRDPTMKIKHRLTTDPCQLEFAFCETYPVHGIIAPLPTKHHAESNMSPEQIFAKWEPLAHKCVANWNIQGYDRDDLLQEARMAICRVAKKFDASRGGFFTVAQRAIKNRLATISLQTKRQKRTAYVTSLDESIDLGDEGGTANLYDILESREDLPTGMELEELLKGYLDRIRNRRARDMGKMKAEMDEALRIIKETFGIELTMPKPRRVNQSLASA